jgi:hypothetical protein
VYNVRIAIWSTPCASSRSWVNIALPKRKILILLQEEYDVHEDDIHEHGIHEDWNMTYMNMNMNMNITYMT